ncbi:hypothetical protein AWB81_06839 [Caballeronia arationis]|jgi:hypothetical protein|uniref:DUF3564 family protein n=1 Tax=Caballeronia arationis TaxID=1777142 RepID=A0A7Z7N2K3_9BURK|nr:DUF3564 family protein [Caballeronia arationis]SAL04749.1 hypothetical protein AWB81_06839 [Caballeronia arationis]SOE67058.1 Protein of unknown function [Caballeronia arationis]
MRVTVKLDTFDQTNSAYAVLWLDTKTRRWSREGHAGIDVPQWGVLESSAGGTLLRDANGMLPIVLLSRLHLERCANRNGSSITDGPSEGARGSATYHGSMGLVPRTAHWHVQCLDLETTVAEHEIFSDEDESARRVADGTRDTGSFGT